MDGEFRTLRQAAGWLGLALLTSEQAGHLLGAQRVSDAVLGAGILLVTLSVFGPAAAALLIRAFRGSGGDSDD